MWIRPITINDFKGWLNLSTTSDIADNEFQIANNVFYNQKGQIQTRYGYTKFGNAVGSNKPITSYFFYQRDDTLATTALCVSGTNMYKYDEWTGNWSSIKSGLTEYEVAPASHRTRWDFAVYKNIIYMCNGVDDYASYDGATYTTYWAQPNIRYITYIGDRMFWAGDDTTPSTLYYTGAAPANANTINTNVVIVGGDELGRINGLNELGNIILALKSGKIYSIDVTNQRAEPIDAQTGWYSDRTIANVANSLVYLTDRWVDTLRPRQWVAGASALESQPLDANVRELTSKIIESQLNANCAWYIKKLNNYYISITTNGSNIPDSTLVYNSLVNAWTQYSYPWLYDFGVYIDTDWVYHYLFASSTTDQIYEMESGFDDDWTAIPVEIKSKDFDFGEPWQFKTYSYVDITGQKSRFSVIDLTIEVDWEVVGGGQISDDNITSTTVVETLGTRPLGIDTLTGTASEEIELFPFIVRVPLYATGNTINFGMSSESGVWILQKVRMWVNAEPIDVFGYENII